MKFAAICSAGLEGLVEEEISGLGGSDVERGRGSVTWSGLLESGYRACLWSRFATKILMPVAEFTAECEDDLYNKVMTVNWQNHFSTNETFAVDCALTAGSPFKHSQYTALRVKDGIADYFRKSTGSRPDVRVERPDLRINVHVDKSRSVLSIDLSGESLHRRGYRSQGGEAPLKETLAAAIIKLSGWKGEGDLFDPMCGSGTLLIEAAMMFGDCAPGLGRKYFGLVGWKGHDDDLWASLVSEAIERDEAGQKKAWPRFVGYDADQSSVSHARANIKKAGFEYKIEISCKELHATRSIGKQGCLVCNPPYGERLSEKEIVKYLYRSLGNRLKESFPGWCVGLFTSNPDFADMTGIVWAGKHRLYNGPISCRMYVGSVENKQIPRFRWSISKPEKMGKGADFANRLRKNLKKTLSWATKEGVECFRIYDRDMPEYNVCIDIYGKWVHIQEFAAPSSIGEVVAAERFQTVLKVVRSVLAVGRDRVYIKTRRRQKGKKQYEKKAKGQGKMYEVREGGASFLVNFTDYLDTGLFLDHRNTRLRIAKNSKGARFLNLFGYTGSATVQAALGGAVTTTTVDLSNTYLHWAELNLSLNGIYSVNHRMVRADCLEWLKESSDTYDLIFVDPPTFSNTRKKGRVFDLQKQHPLVIELAMMRLQESGLLIFSTNYKSFKFEQDLLKRFKCRNISKQTLPRDFQGSPRTHQCWEIRHG